MTNQPDRIDYTGAHFENGTRVLTSRHTLPGRYHGDIRVSSPRTAYQEREAAREAFDAVLKTLALPTKTMLELELTANTVAVMEWSLGLARLVDAFARDVGGVSVLFVENDAAAGDADAHPENTPTARYPARAILPQLRRRGHRVIALMAAALAVGMLIGRGWRR